jgi:PhnB protein
MAKINPYLVFNGNCETAFNFYKSVFGGEFLMVERFKDIPPAAGQTFSEKDGELLMHISLPIGGDTILMGSDASPNMPPVNVGQNISLSVGAESKREAGRIFQRLAEGGKVTMPIADMFLGSYFGMLTDRFDVNWMVSFEYPKND